MEGILSIAILQWTGGYSNIAKRINKLVFLYQGMDIAIITGNRNFRNIENV